MVSATDFFFSKSGIIYWYMKSMVFILYKTQQAYAYHDRNGWKRKASNDEIRNEPLKDGYT